MKNYRERCGRVYIYSIPAVNLRSCKDNRLRLFCLKDVYWEPTQPKFRQIGEVKSK